MYFVRHLLKAGPNVDSTTEQGKTAPEVVNLLLRKGADIRAILKSSETPSEERSHLRRTSPPKYCGLIYGDIVGLSSYGKRTPLLFAAEQVREIICFEMEEQSPVLANRDLRDLAYSKI